MEKTTTKRSPSLLYPFILLIGSYRVLSISSLQIKEEGNLCRVDEDKDEETKVIRETNFKGSKRRQMDLVRVEKPSDLEFYKTRTKRELDLRIP